MIDRKLSDVIGRFSGVRVLVIGEAMLDSYLEGDARRICREAPVPIVDVGRQTDMAGGAAKAPVNAAEMGCHVQRMSVVGGDAEGERVLELAARAGVDVEPVLSLPGRTTLAKRRVVSAGQLLLRFDQGSTDPVSGDVEHSLIERLRGLAGSCDAIIASDYGYGVIGERMIDALAALRSRSAPALIVDSRNLRQFRRARPAAIKPNYDEALKLLGEQPVDGPDARAEQIAAHGERLLAMTGAHAGAITLDADGAIMFERGEPPYRTYARPARNSRAAGAGDTFVSALAAALAAGAATTTAAEVASAAAAVVVAKDGTSICSAMELREQLASGDKSVGDVARFAQRMQFYRAQGKRVVFTNGCFDILHRGHITYLNRAMALGDLLVVGVNSDGSVRRLKGESRPINGLDDRVQVLEALSCIDHVVAFDEDTPVELIRRIQPDVYVKGGDYTRETLPETPVVEALGGVVHILPYLEERSTTGVIERIRLLQDEPRATRRADGSGNGRSKLGKRASRPLRQA
jgi:D-beta-D-heptose 7-phosphate kinase/D-beta-D-heptose 1-phosphate adenosyltransferase